MGIKVRRIVDLFGIGIFFGSLVFIWLIRFLIDRNFEMCLILCFCLLVVFSFLSLWFKVLKKILKVLVGCFLLRWCKFIIRFGLEVNIVVCICWLIFGFWFVLVFLVNVL